MDNKYKKRMLKNWAIQFADNKADPNVNIGSTVKQSKSIDDVLEMCEAVETQSEIVVAEMDKIQIRSGLKMPSFPVINESLMRLLKELKKARSTLSGLNFKDLPRTDVAKLESYSTSLKEYYDRIDEILTKEKDENVVNTPEEFQLAESNLNQQEGVLRQSLQNAQDRVVDLYGRRQQKADEIQQRRNTTPTMRDAYYAKILADQIADMENNIIPQIESDLDDILLAQKNVKKNAKIAVPKRIKGEITTIDADIILPVYKSFLDNLKDGLQRYNSGLTGKLVGGYILACGSPDYIARRFL